MIISTVINQQDNVAVPKQEVYKVCLDAVYCGLPNLKFNLIHKPTAA